MLHFFQKPPINENQVGGFGNCFYPDIYGWFWGPPVPKIYFKISPVRNLKF